MRDGRTMNRAIGTPTSRVANSLLAMKLTVSVYETRAMVGDRLQIPLLGELLGDRHRVRIRADRGLQQRRHCLRRIAGASATPTTTPFRMTLPSVRAGPDLSRPSPLICSEFCRDNVGSHERHGAVRLHEIFEDSAKSIQQ